MILAITQIPLEVVLLLAAVACLSFYLNARNDLSECRKENREKDIRIATLAARAGGLSAAGDADDPALTADLVCDALRYNGFVPETEEGAVKFRSQGEVYRIVTETLPYVTVGQWFSLEKDKLDMRLFRQATADVTRSMVIGKAALSDDGLAVRFSVNAWENRYSHFRDALPVYMDIIKETQGRHRQRYNELVDLEEQKDRALAGPALPEGRAENKILS